MEQIQITHSQITEETKMFFQRVYAWMFLGLFISGFTAYIVGSNAFLYQSILFNRPVVYSLLVMELVMIFVLAKFIKKISANLATFLFFLYCFMTGLTLSVIFLAFTIESIGMVFFITAGMFGVMSIYGHVTKRDLTEIGQVLLMGLFGIVVASLTNLFYNNPMVDYIVSIVGVVVFTGLAAYDTQRIRKYNTIGNEGTPEDFKESIIGALTLYLDFINLFLKLLRLFGKGKR